MTKEIETPFLESFANYWASGIKLLKWRYDNFIKKELNKWAIWGERLPPFNDAQMGGGKPESICNKFEMAI